MRWMDRKYEQKVGSGGRQNEDKEGEKQTRQNLAQTFKHPEAMTYIHCMFLRFLLLNRNSLSENMSKHRGDNKNMYDIMQLHLVHILPKYQKTVFSTKGRIFTYGQFSHAYL